MSLKKVISNWNNYPKIWAEISEPDSEDDIISTIKEYKSLIARGNGMSYGDASLNENILSTLKFNSILDFDLKNQTITVESGVLLELILNFIVPYGFFLNVLPGTKFISVGGAIAANIHGKNHVSKGSFSEYVMEMTLVNDKGQIVLASRENNQALFYSTFGAMGLTGIILTAKIKLRSIPSTFLKKNVLCFYSLKDLLNAFIHTKSEYSIAWLDFFSFRNDKIKSIFQTGDFVDTPIRIPKDTSSPNHTIFTVPFYLPSWCINHVFIRIFNWVHFQLSIRLKKGRYMHYNSFLFPLDKIKYWNKSYGSNGFIQYQFVLPMHTAMDGISEVLREIESSRSWVTLCTLKRLGSKNIQSPMSFPEEGFTLALDFKMVPRLFELLDQLDHIVLKNKGKVYLAKDARMKSTCFWKMYPVSLKFKPYFSSLLSARLKLNVNR